jgi:purine nucleoside permease
MSCPASGEWKAVPAGWTSPEQGYWCDEETGRATLTAIRTYKEESLAWRKAYTDLKSEFITTQKEMSDRLDALEQAFAEEKTSLVQKSRRDVLIWGIVACGVGYLAGR